jgi:hypothetical protein
MNTNGGRARRGAPTGGYGYYAAAAARTERPQVALTDERAATTTTGRGLARAKAFSFFLPPRHRAGAGASRTRARPRAGHERVGGLVPAGERTARRRASVPPGLLPSPDAPRFDAAAARPRASYHYTATRTTPYSIASIGPFVRARSRRPKNSIIA